MTELLLRIFVKDYGHAEKPAVRTAVGSMAGTVGILCNCLLALGKLIAGLLAGSVSIVADSLNNLSDAASSVVTLLGFRLARRPADADHPYGHARYEYLSGLAVSALILVVGGELAISSVGRILHPEPMNATALTYGILIVSAAVKLWMRFFYGGLGRRIHSAALQAASVDSRNDVAATAAVLLGCAVHDLWNVNIDGWIGLGVAVFILYSGVRMASETISPLLGKRADEQLTEKLSELVLSHEHILGIHDLLVHDYGPGQCYASLHAELSAREDPLACHEIIDDIEQNAWRQLNVHLVIHYDPVATDDEEWNEMHALVDRIVAGIDPRLSVHDFRVAAGTGQPKLVFDLAMPYEMLPARAEVRRKINENLAAAGHPYATVIRCDGKK